MEIFGMTLFYLGMLGSIAGGLWFLFEAFSENILWGLGCLFLPFVSLFFLVIHWNKAGRPFLLQIASIAPIVAGIFLGFSPS
ncbi:hypothetical protein CA54_27930 [Symmachiella macrocystis]|uniref:Major facilitator superfamily (MFS) profile domain-containing protein n=1 Tax=Symmachiella macrocystis TaxID=2527985 RepID=A0A5C6BRB8_9PLAN|nr:hypothetical protein [Symmachiella macrocystis]TWU13951.1 hypothetical protein CA54_27930 [Symmachiella macrocystis]